MIMVNIKW